DGVADPGVERSASILEEVSVGHLVGERVLEGVLKLGEEGRLVEELGGLEVAEVATERVLGQLRQGPEDGEGDILADNGRRLKQGLLLRREAVETRRQDRLDRGGNLGAPERLRPGG